MRKSHLIPFQYSQTSTPINPDLIPRSSVISAKFITPEVIQKQNILERKMERVRRQTLIPEDEEDESRNEVVRHRSNLSRRDTATVVSKDRRSKKTEEEVKDNVDNPKVKVKL